MWWAELLRAQGGEKPIKFVCKLPAPTNIWSVTPNYTILGLKTVKVSCCHVRRPCVSL